MLNCHRLQLVSVGLLSISLLSFESSSAKAQVGGNIVIEASGPIQISNPLPSLPDIGDVLRTREDEPLIEEPFFEGLGVDVELMVQETATPENAWFISAPKLSEAEPAIALQDLSLSLIGTTGKAERRFVVNAVVQNRSYETSVSSDASPTAQVLLMEGDRVIAEQSLNSPLQPGETIPVQYQLDSQSPNQPWHLVYVTPNETIALYPEANSIGNSQRPALQELQEQDLFQ